MSQETKTGPMPYQIKPGFFYIPMKTIFKGLFNVILGTMIVYAFCTFMIFLEIERYQLIECHSREGKPYVAVFDTVKGVRKQTFIWE